MTSEGSVGSTSSPVGHTENASAIANTPEWDPNCLLSDLNKTLSLDRIVILAFGSQTTSNAINGHAKSQHNEHRSDSYSSIGGDGESMVSLAH
jgi:hypothetical protein